MHDPRAATRFMLGMLVFAALLVAGSRLSLGEPWLASIVAWNAQLIAALLDLQGIEVLRRGAVLHHADGFTCRIDPACTGLPILALIVAAVLLYPTTIALRMRALGFGLPLFFGVNILRMLHLIRTGIDAPESFQFAHDVTWRIALLVLFTLGWTCWRQVAHGPALPTPIPTPTGS